MEKDSSEDAISLLDILPNIDLIISREQIDHAPVALKIAQYLQKNHSNIPLLVIGERIECYENTLTIKSDESWKGIIQTAAKIIGMEVNFDTSRVTSDYVPVSIQYFFNINSLSFGCDVYIRVKNGEIYQYIKRLHSTDQFERSDIERYKKAGLREFFIAKEHFPQFVNYVTDQLLLKLDSPNLSKMERISLTADTYEMTLERIHTLGIDDYTIALFEESVKAMEHSLQENNALLDFLHSLRANKHSYAYAHTYLVSLILHKLVESFEWETPQIKEKLTYISFFHDISLPESELMKVHSLTELEELSLPRAEKNLVLNHAFQSAEIIERFPRIPPGVGAIIREHHGSKSGIGFPKTLSIAIAPLSMMFIVVEDFVDSFLKIEELPKRSDFESIFNQLEKKYTKVTYVQTLSALKKMTLGK
nr:transcriptional regulator [Bacteriovorax sp. HI3]